MFLQVTGLLLLLFQGLPAQVASGGAEASTVESGVPIPLASCPAGGPIGAVDLAVRSPKGGQTLPFRLINHLSEGDTLSYSPVIHGREKRAGEVAIVMVTAKRKEGQQVLLVTDPKPAEKPQSWKISETISVAAFVYGPQGLSKKKVRKFLSQDEQV